MGLIAWLRGRRERSGPSSPAAVPTEYRRGRLDNSDLNRLLEEAGRSRRYTYVYVADGHAVGWSTFEQLRARAVQEAEAEGRALRPGRFYRVRLVAETAQSPAPRSPRPPRSQQRGTLNPAPLPTLSDDERRAIVDRLQQVPILDDLAINDLEEEARGLWEEAEGLWDGAKSLWDESS